MRCKDATNRVVATKEDDVSVVRFSVWSPDSCSISSTNRWLKLNGPEPDVYNLFWGVCVLFCWFYRCPVVHRLLLSSSWSIWTWFSGLCPEFMWWNSCTDAVCVCVCLHSAPYSADRALRSGLCRGGGALHWESLHHQGGGHSGSAVSVHRTPPTTGTLGTLGLLVCASKNTFCCLYLWWTCLYQIRVNQFTSDHRKTPIIPSGSRWAAPHWRLCVS